MKVYTTHNPQMEDLLMQSGWKITEKCFLLRRNFFDQNILITRRLSL